MKKYSIALSCALVASIMIGCGNDVSSKTSTDNKLRSASFTQTVKPSISKKNPHVIDASTMVKWLDDWKKYRPSSVKGKLIILQVGGAFNDDIVHTFIKHDDVHVFTFDKSGDYINADLMVNENSDVQIPPKTLLSEQTMDDMLKIYNIDPNKDMVLIVTAGDKKAKDQRKNASSTVRFAWSMKHWGISHYAVLNGDIQQILNPKTNPSIKNQSITSLDDIFVPDASIPPMYGTHSIKEIASHQQKFR